MKLWIYLDTSVFSAYLDERAPERLAETREFWSRLDGFEPYSSSVAADELARTPDLTRRARLQELFRQVVSLPTAPDTVALAQSYVSLGAFSEEQRVDALHVAAAVLGRMDVLVSWNFRHLVNRRRRNLLAAHNSTLGLPVIEILSPPELIGE